MPPRSNVDKYLNDEHRALLHKMQSPKNKIYDCVCISEGAASRFATLYFCRARERLLHTKSSFVVAEVVSWHRLLSRPTERT